MGFEQLAALKAQLAAQAKAEKAAKAAEVPKRATPPRARDAAPANPAKPVDPVVHTIARLQRRFPLCRGARYWACLIEGASRMGLAGQEAGQVRPEDAKRALQLQARRSPGAPSKSAKASHPVDAAR